MDINVKEGKKPNQKVRRTWTENEEIVFIDVWRDFLSQLRSVKRNKKIYENMSSELEVLGVKADAKEIKIKIQNLSQKYREEKKLMGPSGGTPSKWVHFEKIHELIGRNKCNDPQIAQESFSFVAEETILPTDSNSSSFLELQQSSSSSYPAFRIITDTQQTPVQVMVTRTSSESITENPAEPTDPLPSPVQTVKTPLISPSSGPTTASKPTASKRKKEKDFNFLEELKRTNDILEEEMKLRQEIEKDSQEIEKKKVKLMESQLEIQKALLGEIQKLTNKN